MLALQVSDGISKLTGVGHHGHGEIQNCPRPVVDDDVGASGFNVESHCMMI